MRAGLHRARIHSHRELSSGLIVYVGREASVQFRTPCDIFFRIIRVLPIQTYAGWVWLDGYQLDVHRTAVARRSIWVQWAGLVRI